MSSVLRERTAALRRRRAALIACTVSLWLGAGSLAWSQAAPPQQPVAPLTETGEGAPNPPSLGQPAPAQAPSRSEPGLIDQLGGLIKDSIDSVSSNLKGTQQKIEDLNKDTAEQLTRLPVTGFAMGRMICPRADNGAPDCRVASDQLCRSKGYKTGRGLDIETAENCNPRVLVPGYQRKEGDCTTDNYVTRAACN